MGTSKSLFEQLKATKRLPSPPRTAVRVLELCRNEDSSVQEIADTIMSDPALSSRLLRYANSSIVGAGRKVTSTRDAVRFLGLRSVKLTALGFSIAGPDFEPRCARFDLPRFWAESFAAAAISRRVAAELHCTDREEAFTAGLLARIGRLALAHCFPQEYTEALEAMGPGKSLAMAERECFGISHAEFGARLLEEWGLPDLLLAAVHDQIGAVRPAASETGGRFLPWIVNVATRLAPLFAHPADVRPADRQHHCTLVEQELGLEPSSWQSVADGIFSDYRQVAELFDARIEGPTSPFDLYSEAQDQTTRLTIEAEYQQQQLTEENRDLLRRATTDALTGIANRARFDERLLELVAAHRRGHGDFALLMLDIDHFKHFNDTFGHDVGDLVLRQVAQALRAALRGVDLVARYGGEEFAILAPHTNSHGACTVAARMCQCVDHLRITHDGTTLHVTISAGLALTSDYPKPPDADRLRADADRQLYVAKHAGRNTWAYLGRTAAQNAPLPVRR